MRYAFHRTVLLCSIVVGLQTASASAEKRVALVIGNATYGHIAHLANVPNDTAAMAALFKAAKFDAVDVKQNLGVAELRRALRDFAGRAANADVAVVFYAGHGIEVGQVNYLIPVDARLVSDFDVEDETVPQVLTATGNKQEPYVTGSLGGGVVSIRNDPPKPPAAGPQSPPPLVGERPSPHAVVQSGGLFGERDAKQVQSLADKHRLPVPDFRLEVPDGDVPATLRSFVGIWVDPTASARKSRTNMLVVERVDREGRADGWWVYGPPAAKSSFPGDPAGAFKFAGTITDKTLRFASPKGLATYRNRLTSEERMDHFWSHSKGLTNSVVLIPVWTLVDAERAAKQAPGAAKRKADVEVQAKRVADEATEHEQKASRRRTTSCIVVEYSQ